MVDRHDAIHQTLRDARVDNETVVTKLQTAIGEISGRIEAVSGSIKTTQEAVWQLTSILTTRDEKFRAMFEDMMQIAGLSLEQQRSQAGRTWSNDTPRDSANAATDTSQSSSGNSQPGNQLMEYISRLCDLVSDRHDRSGSIVAEDIIIDTLLEVLDCLRSRAFLQTAHMVGLESNHGGCADQHELRGLKRDLDKTYSAISLAGRFRFNTSGL